MRSITMGIGCGKPCMSTETQSPDSDSRPPLPQDDFSDTLLDIEREPMAGGGKRALLYPHDRSGSELSTYWLALPDSLLVDVADVR